MNDVTSVRTVATADALAEAAAKMIVQEAATAIESRGRFSIALSGGSTPEKLYGLLASQAFSPQIDWSRVLVFMGDERLVPPDDDRSNFGMASRTMLRHVPIPFRNVLPVQTQTRTAAEAADRYATAVAEAFDLAPGGPPPIADLFLLGVGEDGHTASLFPGMPSLHERSAWFVGSPPGRMPPPVDRISATFPFINATRHALFLAAGKAKAQIVHDVLESPDAAERFPSARVRPNHGNLTWLLDEAAAAGLNPQTLSR